MGYRTLGKGQSWWHPGNYRCSVIMGETERSHLWIRKYMHRLLHPRPAKERHLAFFRFKEQRSGPKARLRVLKCGWTQSFDFATIQPRRQPRDSRQSWPSGDYACCLPQRPDSSSQQPWLQSSSLRLVWGRTHVQGIISYMTPLFLPPFSSSPPNVLLLLLLSLSSDCFAMEGSMPFGTSTVLRPAKSFCSAPSYSCLT